MDVDRTLGPPAESSDKEQVTYYFPDVVVYFYFTSNPKCRQKLPYTSWDVTADTRTGIDVRLRHPSILEETGIDLSKFKKVKGHSDMVNSSYYLSDDGSFAIDAGSNYVSGYHYQPGIKQRDLVCEVSQQP
jgi:hypothetical protein